MTSTAAEMTSSTESDALTTLTMSAFVNGSGNSTTTAATTTVTYSPLGDHTVGQVVVISIVAVVLMLVTVVGNFLVIWSYRINRRLRDINNMFLVSLACSDLVIGVVSMNLYPISMITRRWWMGSAVCTIWLCVDYTLSMASVANLLLICFDRYLSVTRPFTYRPRRTRSRAQIMIVSAWVISFLLFTPLIVFWPSEASETECLLPFVESEIIVIVTATLAFFLPIFIMAVLYGIIYKETRKCAQYLAHNNRQRSNTITTALNSNNNAAADNRNPSLVSPSAGRKLMPRRSTIGAAASAHRNSASPSAASSHHNQISSSERKAARTLSAILLAFFVTWLPYNVCVVVKTLCGPDSVPGGAWDAAYYLCYINSTINPFCFALCNKTFRRTFVRILTCEPGAWRGADAGSSRVYYESSSSSNNNHHHGGDSNGRRSRRSRRRNPLLRLSCGGNHRRESDQHQRRNRKASTTRNSKTDVIL